MPNLVSLQTVRREISESLKRQRLLDHSNTDGVDVPSDGDVLTYSAADRQWHPSADQGVTGSFEAADSTGLTEITGTEARVPLTEVTNSDSANFTLSGNRVTISKAGLYAISPRFGAGGTAGGGAWGARGYVKVDGAEISNGTLPLSRGA